ncbi:MAG: 3'-5' exoribonuclease, partial [Clostridia bacterium]|nr:3'-5' exoribonuclease [Clostridia bacterium]
KRSGLTLKLDIRDLCPSCQADKNCADMDTIQMQAEKLKTLEAFYEQWKVVPDAHAEEERILAAAHQESERIISDANEYKEKALREIEQAKQQIEKKKEEIQYTADAAVVNAQAHIAALLASASKDFITMGKDRALKDPDCRPSKFKKMTPAAFAKAAEKAFIAFDLETTGLSAARNEIIEIGAIKYVNMEKVAEFNTLVKPRKPIPASATAINNITNAMVEDAPDLATALSGFIAFIEDMPLVAHNADFDVGFLERALIIAGISVDIKYGDSLAIARKKFKGLDSYRLGSVGEFLGSKTIGLHRALADCAIVGDIVCTDESDVLSFTF